MPNTSDPNDPSKKKANYNYSWPVPTRKPKTEPKRSASNDKVGNKNQARINRTTV